MNFLNLFENREDMKILDPFVGNGTTLLFALLQDFQIFGSDVDEIKVKKATRNINWLLELLEEEIPFFINERVLNVDVKEISSCFEQMDGILTEPELGPYYLEKPYYLQVKELFETKLEPLYDAFFREAYKVLKDKGRICFIAPIINTIDGNDVQIDISKIASKFNFKQIPLINPDRFFNKSNPKLQIFHKSHKTLIDTKKGQIIKRKIFVFEKNEV